MTKKSYISEVPQHADFFHMQPPSKKSDRCEPTIDDEVFHLSVRISEIINQKGVHSPFRPSNDGLVFHDGIHVNTF